MAISTAKIDKARAYIEALGSPLARKVAESCAPFDRDLVKSYLSSYRLRDAPAGETQLLWAYWLGRDTERAWDVFRLMPEDVAAVAQDTGTLDWLDKYEGRLVVPPANSKVRTAVVYKKLVGVPLLDEKSRLSELKKAVLQLDRELDKFRGK